MASKFGWRVNRSDFQLLATDRLQDDSILMRAVRLDGAYYRFGLALECALTRGSHTFENLQFSPSKLGEIGLLPPLHCEGA